MTVLSAATVALLGYSLSILTWSTLDLASWSQLEVWADLSTGALALVLVPAAVLVRVRIPGGIPLACAGLAGLQAINLHNSMHMHGEIAYVAEGARAVFGGVVLWLAWAGGRAEAKREEGAASCGSPTQT